MLSDFLGNDLSRLSKELDKLALILPEKGAKRITPELVEQNIGISKEYNNFELIKALAMKDVLKANRIAQYFEKNPKSNPIQMTLPVLFNDLLLYEGSFRSRLDDGTRTSGDIPG